MPEGETGSAKHEPGSTESGRRLRANHRVGTVLVERFELIKLLGIGAFGEVYQAHDRQNPNSAVAIKVLRRPSAQALYRFKREFRALGEWTHPNLVALHELFLDGEVAFFTMALVPGVPFHRFVRPDGNLSRARLISAARGLCEGVSALHERGRLHRDLKPANVLVGSNGHVVIVDLGLATLFGRGSAMGSEVGFIGTVQYAAPEQLAAGAVGPETDWYAVGTMLYEALSGALPYDAPFSELLSHKSRPPFALAPRGDELDPLREVCVALLQPDKSLRAGGNELRAALGHLSTPDSVREAPFIGRSEQLEALEQTFQEVERGACRVVVVDGPSGLGKTALVERFLDELRDEHRASVLSGRCYVNEEVTYQAVDGNIDALSHHLLNLPRSQAAALLPRDVRSLACLFPVLNRVEAIANAPPIRSLDDKASLRDRAGAALRELVGRLSDHLPLVLFIDDVQWDDADSAWLMSKVLAAPDPPALLLLTTCRSEGRKESHLLRKLESEPTTACLIREIVLPALSATETVTLAGYASTEASEHPELAERIAVESAGHPMFALELSRFARRNNADVATPQLSLDAALRSRAEALSPAARRLLEIACVAGRPLKYSVAVAAATCEIDALREVVASKLVSISGTASDDMLSIYHDRIRESELSVLPAERVRALHGTLADALARDQERFDLIVDHYLASGQRQTAARYALRAADHATAVLAFHRLPAMLLLAIENPDETAPGPLYLRLAESYALLGQRGAAAEAYEQAAALEPDPEQRWELSSLVMWQAFHAQDLKQGFRLLHELDGALGKERLRLTFVRVIETLLRAVWWMLFGPPKLREKPPGNEDGIAHKRLRLCFRAYITLVATHGEYAVFYAIEALRLAAKLGDKALYAGTLGGYALAISMRKGLPTEKSERLLQEAVALAADQPDVGIQLMVASCRAGYSICTAQMERGYQELGPLLEADFPITPFGTFLRSLILYTMGAPVFFWSGRIVQAQLVGQRAVASAAELSDPRVEWGLRATLAFRLLGDDHGEMAWKEWETTSDRYPLHPALKAPIFGMPLALYRGNFKDAQKVMTTAWRLFFGWEAHFAPSRHMFVWWWGALAAARLRSGETGLGLRLRLALAVAYVCFRAPKMTEPLAECLRASRAFLRGKPELGVRALERGRAGLETYGLRLYSACASHALGSLHPDPQTAEKYAAMARTVFEIEKIRRPDRWVRALLPGLPELKGDALAPEPRADDAP